MRGRGAFQLLQKFGFPLVRHLLHIVCGRTRACSNKGVIDRLACCLDIVATCKCLGKVVNLTKQMKLSHNLLDQYMQQQASDIGKPFRYDFSKSWNNPFHKFTLDGFDIHGRQGQCLLHQELLGNERRHTDLIYNETLETNAEKALMEREIDRQMLNHCGVKLPPFVKRERSDTATGWNGDHWLVFFAIVPSVLRHILLPIPKEARQRTTNFVEDETVRAQTQGAAVAFRQVEQGR